MFDHPEARRYEIVTETRVAGFADYVPLRHRVVFTHTEIDPEFEGRGFGSRLVRAALDDVAGRGLTVTPVCPFVAEFIREHPDYAPLVDDGRRTHP